ncbi:MAG: hypothetical protein IKP28_03785 [Clostridia bacterium]|nr:hypothetical protein [Clostridia bacterium]
MNENYVLLYGPKKVEDIIFATNMFKHTRFIPIGWTKNSKEIINKTVEEEISNNISQIIFWGLEDGWDYTIEKIKKEHPEIKIKVICNTSNSLLYYEYERRNFVKMLDLSTNDKIDDIGFLRKNMYDVYSKLGYKSSYILENLQFKESHKKAKTGEILQIGFYPFNYTWDKNIYNQLSIGKFLKDCVINYNFIDKKMEEFLKVMNINSQKETIENTEILPTAQEIQPIDINNIADTVCKNDINIACDFTDYVHTLYFLSMENDTLCIIGNNSELFDEGLVVNSEDNPIEISKKIEEAVANKETIMQNYKKWKSEYNIASEESINKFINK